MGTIQRKEEGDRLLDTLSGDYHSPTGQDKLNMKGSNESLGTKEELNFIPLS